MSDQPPEIPVVAGLRGLRQHCRLSQRQIAERMGISQQRVSELERAWPRTRLSSAQAFARACDGRLQVTIRYDTDDTDDDHVVDWG